MDLQTFLLGATVFLGAAIIFVPIAHRLGLGSVMGYLFAGILIGPVFGIVKDAETLQHFGEFGVVLMLFVVGLELKPSMLWNLRIPILGTGGAQVVITTLLLTIVGLAFGLRWQFALCSGLILSLSSTAIVLQSLNERGLMNTSGGQSIFSILLFQDIAVIPMLALMPLLATLTQSARDIHNAELEGHTSIALHLEPWAMALATFAAVAIIILGGHYLLRPIFRIIVRTRIRELFIATSLFLVFATAILMQLVGLSPALGTFLAGVVLADSEYRHELESEIDPFRGLLLGLFFITVGASLNLGLIASKAPMIAALVVGFIIVKFISLVIVAKIFRFNNPKTVLFAFALSQGSEFAFLLFNFARNNRVLPESITQMLISVVVVSMFIAPLLMVFWERVVAPRFAEKSGMERDPDEISEDSHGDIIIAGYGRFGSIVGRLVKMAGQKIVVLDLDSEQIDAVRRLEEEVYYGDATRADLMATAGAAHAKLFIVAIDEKEKAIEMVKTVKKHFPQLKILARAWDRRHAYDLLSAGADYVQRETVGSAISLGEEALKHLGMHRYEAHRIARVFSQNDKRMMLEMWHDFQEFQNSGDMDAYVEKFKNNNVTLTEVVAREAKNDYGKKAGRGWGLAKADENNNDDKLEEDNL